MGKNKNIMVGHTMGKFLPVAHGHTMGNGQKQEYHGGTHHYIFIMVWPTLQIPIWSADFYTKYHWLSEDTFILRWEDEGPFVREKQD